MYSKNNASSGQLYLRITVVNSNREVLELLRGIYEGGISTKKKYKTTDKQCWTWQVSSHKAKVFLFDIYEFFMQGYSYFSRFRHLTLLKKNDVV